MKDADEHAGSSQAPRSAAARKSEPEALARESGGVSGAAESPGASSAASAARADAVSAARSASGSAETHRFAGPRLAYDSARAASSARSESAAVSAAPAMTAAVPRPSTAAAAPGESARSAAASPAAPPPVSSAGLEKLNRLSVWWNGWFFLEADKKHMPVPKLQPGNTYKYRLDISRYLYEEARGTAVAPALAREITTAVRQGLKTVEIVIRPKLVGPLEFSAEPQLEKRLVIEVPKLVLNDAVQKADAANWQKYSAGTEGLRWLSQKVSAAFVEYNVKANSPGGCGFVLMTIWSANGLTPIDALTHAVPIGDQPDGCGTAERGADALQSLAGAGHLFDLAGLPTSQSANAALQVFEIVDSGNQRSFAFFVDRDKYLSAAKSDALTGPPSSFGFYSWELASKFSVFLNERLPERIFQVRKVFTTRKPVKHAYAATAQHLAEELFTAVDDHDAPEKSKREAADAAAAYGALQRLSREPGEKTIYVRARQSNGESLYIPLGLLAAKSDSPILQNPITVLQPLPIERYGSRSTCVSQWGYAIPPKLAKLDAYSLPQLRKPPAVDPTIPTRWVQDWNVFLKDYLKNSPTLARGRTEGMVLLAHHFGKGYVSWDGVESRDPTNGLRRFPDGSFGLLAACSLTNVHQGNDALLKALNKRGLDMLILSPFDVDAEYGAVLAVAFTQALAEARRAQPATAAAQADPPSITELFARARQITSDYFVNKKMPYIDEMALEFIVLGDYRLKLCGL
jgi:hypothetical protein